VSTMPKPKPIPITDGTRMVPPPEGWPEELSGQAFHGIAGKIVRAIEPHTEADPNAILIQLLIGFGNLIGRRAHIVNDGSRHYMNEFCVLAGRSGRGRKGTAWARALPALKAAEADWSTKRIESGLSSGEGLIEPVKDIEGEGAAAVDKRLLVVEPEFAAVLSAAGRQGNVLSPMIRNAWDTGLLQALTKSPTRATDAHISIIGHITNEELKEKLTKTEQANGFANRFIWICVRRKRKIGRRAKHAKPAELAPLYEQFAAAAQFARGVDEIDLAPDAEPIWEEFYDQLPDETPGIFGALTGRAEGHVTRLASIYALLDQSGVIRPAHLKAAIALWEFSERCVRFIFDKSTGTPVGDTIIAQLRARPEGMTRSDILGLFHRHRSTESIEQIIKSLAYRGHIRSERIATNGRPKEVWVLADREGQAPPELARALREMIPVYSDAAASELWRACRERAADCSAGEISHFVALQMAAIRAGKIHSPVAFILKSAPEWLGSAALAEYRAKQRPPSAPEEPRDIEAEIDNAHRTLGLYRQLLETATTEETRAIQQANISGISERLAALEQEREGEESTLKRKKRNKRNKASTT